MGKIDALLHQMVEQPSGRRDDDLYTGMQGLDLRFDIDATIDHGRAQRQVLAVGTDRFLDLGCELTRWHQHERPHWMARR